MGGPPGVGMRGNWAGHEARDDKNPLVRLRATRINTFFPGVRRLPDGTGCAQAVPPVRVFRKRSRVLFAGVPAGWHVPGQLQGRDHRWTHLITMLAVA